MRLIVIGLGAQRPPAAFREHLDSSSVFARNVDLARQWLGDHPTQVIGLDEHFANPEVQTLPARLAAEIRSGASSSSNLATYLVPGAANLGDETVRRLASEFDVEIIPGALETQGALGNCHVVDALALAMAEHSYPFDAGSESLSSRVPTVVTNFRGAGVIGLATRRIERDIGREPDRRVDDTLFYDPLQAHGEGADFAGLEQIIARLRSPEGCPWDREQTIASLLPQLEEEIGEFRESLLDDDPHRQADELGDVLLHIVMIGQIARESGIYTTADVVRAISAKMVRRHPHVFGDVEIGSVEELYEMWDEIKSQEKAGRG